MSEALQPAVHLDLVGGMPGEWIEQGACRGMSTALFFAEDPNNVERAKRVCLTRCPVVEECREWVLRQHGLTPGTWGGLSWADRKALRHGPRKRSSPAKSGGSSLPKDDASGAPSRRPSADPPT